MTTLTQTTNMTDMGRRAQIAGRQIATLSTADKNSALYAIADRIEARSAEILAANALDIADAKAKGTSAYLVDRLLLTEKRVAALANDTRQVATLPDPIGAAIDSRVLPNGIRLSRRRIPIGVIGVIYEARPNVTIDIATLCLKTANATILRGGKETLRSNLALVEVIQSALSEQGLPADAVQYIGNTDRALIRELIQLDEYVDMIIPRGGNALHDLCRKEGSIPVITGGIGICHAFVDESAEFPEALDIIENSKIQRPSVCNSLDTVLVHQNIAGAFLPQLAERMAENDVQIHAADQAFSMLQGKRHGCKVVEAVEGDFDIEWLGLTMGVKIVADTEEAIAHVQTHSTDHTDTILTNDWRNANRFVDAISSSAVFVNASTRFNDGGQFGLGAEVAVSTQKLHARGPMGLEELTTYKWIGIGDGHVRP